MNRYILAYDNGELYFRKTPCVTHDAITGEVIYRCKPVRVNQKKIKIFISALKKNKKKEQP